MSEGYISTPKINLNVETKNVEQQKLNLKKFNWTLG